MNGFDGKEWVHRVFLRLIRSRFNVGVGEYLAALDALDGGFGEDVDALQETLKLLWCYSIADQERFDRIWAAVKAQIQARTPSRPPFPGGKRVQFAAPEQQTEPQDTTVVQTQRQQQDRKERSGSEMGALPIQAPGLMMDEESGSDLQAYYPISRRSMVYNWRYLRRPVADGPRDVLDIDRTIGQVVRQGFYLAPVYGRRERNGARLLLLIDQNGSMTPFHHFSRDLVVTAQTESTLEPENVMAYYFQNVPSAQVYRDGYLTESLSVQTMLQECDWDTSVLIVSDAGAARGYRTRGRIRGVSRFLFQLKQRTSLIAWLNPMPKTRWEGSSAEIIANMVPMFQMDNEGLSNAIDVVRGQPLKHSYSASM